MKEILEQYIYYTYVGIFVYVYLCVYVTRLNSLEGCLHNKKNSNYDTELLLMNNSITLKQTIKQCFEREISGDKSKEREY